MPFGVSEVHDAQFRREARGLARPVEDQRPRHDHERRLARARRVAAPRLEHRQHHDGLAQAHVVGQAATEAEIAQEAHPAERLALIVTQLAAKGRRRIFRADPLEAPDGVARAFEPRVPVHVRL
jgi:hypothetical protein